MKRNHSLALAAALLCTTTLNSIDSHGNPYGGQDMQKMMQMMQEAQACMEKVDQSQLEKLHQQGIRTMSQLASLSDEMLKNLEEDLQSKGKAFEQQWREQAEQFLNAMSGNK